MTLRKSPVYDMHPEAYKEMVKTEDRHWWFMGRRQIISTTLTSLQLPENPKILEIGCGTGGNLEMLSQFGTISAMDMNQYAIGIASTKIDDSNNLKQGHCPDKIPFKENSFDLICLFDVLEHIDNDVDTLVAIKALLKVNGKIVITVPSYQWMFGAHDKFLHHKRRYSKSQLKKSIHSSGLNISRLTYFNTFLLPIAMIVRLKEKVFKNSTNFGNKVPHPIVNWLLTKIFMSESPILGFFNLPFGLSHLSILQKKQK